jgi:hypothetical protein
MSVKIRYIGRHKTSNVTEKVRKGREDEREEGEVKYTSLTESGKGWKYKW